MLSRPSIIFVRKIKLPAECDVRCTGAFRLFHISLTSEKYGHENKRLLFECHKDSSLLYENSTLTLNNES